MVKQTMDLKNQGIISELHCNCSMLHLPISWYVGGTIIIMHLVGVLYDNDYVIISGLLLTSQLHGASQLSVWCLHFISSNYVIFKDKEGFSKLTGENLEYINEHRWPPLSYEQAMEEYRSKYLAEEDEHHDLGGKAGASTSGDQGDSDHDTGKLDNCTVS